MKGIIQFSLNNKFALWILTLIVTVAGLYSGFTMKMETIPNINVPILSITTVYPGATPEEVLDKVTSPIEQRTRNLEGVSVVNSTSMENVSSIVLEFDYKKDMEQAQAEVKEQLDGLQLPEGVQDSNVSRISLNAFPILTFSVSDSNTDLAELTALVEDSFIPVMEGVEGVADVQISGQHVQEVEMIFNQERMNELGLDVQTVQGIIQGSALQVPLGIFEFGDTEKAVLVDGNIINLDDLRSLQIPVIPGGGGGMEMPAAPPDAGAPVEGAPEAEQPALPEQAPEGQQLPEGMQMPGLPTVPLSEIAEVSVIGKAESISRTNGQDSIGISIIKAADANTVEVVNGIKAEIEQFESQYTGLSVQISMDQGEPIEDSVHTMLNKALIGSLFAVIIILLFLRDVRSTVISVVSIPLSILIALLILSRMDITLNVMTLGAMTVAIGRVIDDSIVVIENIYRRMSLTSEKLTGKQLILESTREMFVPILASTIVTIAVFLPLALVQGAIGEIFLPFALTIVFALLASLLVAITIVPMMAHMMFRKALSGNGKFKGHDDKPGRMAEGYKKILNWSLNHKAITFGGAVVVLLASLLIAPIIGASFLPEEEQKIMTITYNPAPGESLDNVEELALQAEQALMGQEGVQTLQYSVGGQNPMSPGASKQALFFLSYDSDFAGFTEEKDAVLEKLQGIGGTGEWKQQDFMTGGLGGSGLSLFVYGPDMETIRPYVDQVSEMMSSQEQLTNVSTSMSETYEQYVLVADQQKLSQYGLAAGQIAMELNPNRQRPVLTTIEHEGKDLNVYLQVEAATYADRADLENVMLTSPLGMQIPLSEVVTIEEGEAANTITKRNDRVYAEVSATATTDNVASVSSEVQRQVNEMELPPQIEVSFGGVTEQINESFTQLGLAMLAAIAIVYLVLVITFGGGLTPFSILFSLPFTVIGALVGLWIAGETISVTALIGALMLIGIVVTNAIVLIDRVIQKQKEGLPVREALLEAAGTRLRPILMTAIATIGALLPLALGFESGGLISKGLGVTVIGGLTSSTLLTLIIVPIVYEFMSRFRKAPNNEV
ncbi:efflux RND transporter permease subunit [Paenibacillus daejeonensis]|uniref:efflux RND transporter permease subunit n=1 Tax=Paenibacillus daejeonensis TaxID=135193 RepID=UPI000372517B|nr:efflux RND transporter permease subunit [Paenibacillus daejeonensis]